MTTKKHATVSGTARYRDRMVARGISRAHYRQLNGTWISSLGIGTYLGNHDAATDAAYVESISRAVELGTNFIDTAISYRGQRSERAVGAALAKLLAAGTVQRDELVLATKGGFFPFDDDPATDQTRWLRDNVIERGLATADDIVLGQHCMTPAYVRDQLQRSLQNIGVESIDLYYLHNPETQLRSVDRREFLVRLQAAFFALERAVDEGLIRGYGIATWSGFRRDPEEPDYLSVDEVVRVARAAAGNAGHHFCAIQMPFNVASHEALSFANQTVAGNMVNTVAAASGRRIAVVASSALAQGALTANLPDEVQAVCPGLPTDTLRALQFARSAPGITAALVGVGRVDHVEENLALARIAPTKDTAIAELFGL